MLSLLPDSFKTGFAALVLGAILALAGYAVLADYRAKAAIAEADAAQIALTSYQAALTSSQAQVEALKGEQALEARLVAKLDGLKDQNDRQDRAFSRQQAALEKLSEPIRVFLRTRLDPDLQRLLDEEDRAATSVSCGHIGTCDPADSLRKPGPGAKRDERGGPG